MKEAVPEALNFKPRTLSENFLQEHLKSQIEKREIEYFRVVRRELDPERILKHFENTHGLVRDNYTTFRAKDGSARIKIGSIAFNVSDFSTKHMKQSWEDTKTVLNNAYREQRAELEDKHLINSIAFTSHYVTQGYSSKEKLLRLEESITILKYLQQQEKYGEKTMSLAELETHRFKNDLLDSNSISNAEISLLKTADNFKRQQAVANQLSLEMSNLIPVRKIKEKRVDFKDNESGVVLFKDIGDKLVMSKKEPELDDVAAAMTLAAKKFGSLKISGTRAFKQQVIDVAITKNLKVVFDNPKMQEAFVNQKEAYMKKIALEKEALEKSQNGNENQTVNKQGNNAEPKNEPIKLVSFGSAPYLNDKENKESYHATLSNGETLWGVGLKSAIAESGAKVGDEVSINKLGTETVKVNVDVKDEKGNVVSTEEKEVERGSWKVDVKVDKLEYTKLQDATHKELENVSGTKYGYTQIPNESATKDNMYILYRENNGKYEYHPRQRVEQNIDIVISNFKEVGKDNIKGWESQETIRESVRQERSNELRETYITTTQKEQMTLDQLDKKHQSKTKTFDVDYKWSNYDSKMGVTINGKQPDYVPTHILENIIKNDKFLKNYSLDDVKSGKLDLGVANNKFIRNYSVEDAKAAKLDPDMTDNRTFKNYSLEDVESGKLDVGNDNDIQPIPRKFDEQGEIVQAQEETKTTKLKM